MSSFDTTFPFFVIWFDPEDTLPCEGTAHARSWEEAIQLAEIRVLFGSRESFATIYEGSSSGRSKQRRTYRWGEESIIFRDR